MDHLWSEFLRSAFGALSDAVRRDAALRRALREAAQTLLRGLDELEPPARPVDEEPAVPATGVAEPRVEQPAGAAPQAPPSQPPTTELPLTLGNATAIVAARQDDTPDRPSLDSYAPTVVAPASPLYRPTDLRLSARRLRLKAGACRWAIERRRTLREGSDADVADRDQLLFDRAREVQPCYLWMMHPFTFTIPDDKQMEDLAGSYDAVAAAIDLVLLVDDADEASDALEDAIKLLAEAQSAVRAGCSRVDQTLEDKDQRDVFFWLREQTRERGVYVERHMRRDDPAEPADWLRLQERITILRDSVQQRQSARDRRRSLLNRARYHAQRVVAGNAEQNDWDRIAAAIEDMVNHGIPASDREMREIVLPLVDLVPEMEWGAGMQAVFDQVDQYLEQVEREPTDRVARAPSPTLQSARLLLAGRGVVLIGGYPRERQRRKIEQALGLSELRWVLVRHHQSLDSEVRPLFLREEFTVFVTMTRFCSHAFGPQVRDWCRQHGKVYVELPGGYNVEQIAHQVVTQASQQLAPDPSAAGTR